MTKITIQSLSFEAGSKHQGVSWLAELSEAEQKQIVGGSSSTSMQFTLQNTAPSAYQSSPPSSTSQVPIEQVSFTYQKIARFN
jgi:cell division inhibitor SulA